MKWDFFSGIQGWYNICKSINVIHHINKIEDKNHMIISIDAEKAFDKNPAPIYDQISQQSVNRCNIHKHNKDYIWQTHLPASHSIVKNYKRSLLRLGTRHGCPLSLLLFNIVLEVLATAIRQEEIKCIQIGKEEVKLSLFADDIILYIEKHQFKRTDAPQCSQQHNLQ